MKQFYCNGKKRICDNLAGCQRCDFQNGTGGYEIDVPENPYWHRITALAEKQRAKGISKYGQGLEANPAAIVERIKHIQEELIDALMYLEWAKEALAESERHKTN